MPYTPPSKETLKALETAPNMYLILSPDLYILTASDMFLEATRSKREVISGKHMFEAFPEDPLLPEADGIHNIRASLEQVIKTKRPHYMRIQRYDVPDLENPGKFITRYWNPSHTPVLTPDGEIHYIIQLANNVTEKVLAEMALEKKTLANEKLKISEKHFRHLADMVPAKISNALPNGEVIYFNQQWLDYAGMSFEDLRDFGYHQMMHPDEIPTFQSQLVEAAAKGVPLESEMRFKDSTGQYRWHLNIASPVLDDQGEITMWVGSTTDIHRLKEEDQLKSDFIGMVSHEMKTPLTSLSANLQVLQTIFPDSGNAAAKRSLEQAMKQVRKMTTLINGFLNVSYLESSQIAINPTNFKIQELFSEIESERSQSNSNHKIIFCCSPSDQVVADRDKISLVINNLISNAVKYSKHGTTIQVLCKTEKKDIQIAVIDEGMGIDAKALSHVFERYYRADANGQIAGFGIGLYLCAEIIKRHNGKIWAESSLGKGSAFYFCLPRDKGNPACEEKVS